MVKLKIRPCNVFIRKISSYIAAWYSASLSYAGRVELVRTVLQVVECFWLFIFAISATVASKITILCWNFLWVDTKPLVAWNNICLPKHEGRLVLEILKTGIASYSPKCFGTYISKKIPFGSNGSTKYIFEGQTFDSIKRKKDYSPLFKKVLEIGIESWA